MMQEHLNYLICGKNNWNYQTYKKLLNDSEGRWYFVELPNDLTLEFTQNIT